MKSLPYSLIVASFIFAANLHAGGDSSCEKKGGFGSSCKFSDSKPSCDKGEKPACDKGEKPACDKAAKDTSKCASAPSGEMREKLIKRFDKDGDGKLNESEMAGAKQAWAEHQANQGKQGGERPNEEILKRFDKDGDGQLSESEKSEAKSVMQARHQEVLKRFDKDGDGELSESEKAVARQAWEENKGKMESSGHSREELIKRFDVDGDGKLSDAEKTVAKQRMESESIASK